MRLRTIAALASLAVSLSVWAEPIVIFVNANATGANDGTSWTDAFTDLHDALSAADALGGAGVQIWVAAGVYEPSPPDADPPLSYVLVSGTALYGGFAGWETDLDERDWKENETILRRDPPSPGVMLANPILVGEQLARGTLLDGFTVRDGWNWNPGDGTPAPGGLLLLDSTFHITNCTFIENHTTDAIGGGAIHATDTALTLTHCAFMQNFTFVPGLGGAVRLSQCTLSAVGCRFVANSASGGGAIAASNSNISAEDCIFRANSGTFSGSAIEVLPTGTLHVMTCTFEDNGDSPIFMTGSLEIADSTFDCNGGGIMMFGGDAFAERCSFLNNDQGFEGGAVFFSGETIEVRDTVFRGNLTSFSGGNIYIGSATDAIMVNCELTDGRAPRDGGLTLWYGNLTVVNCLFARNRHGGIGVGHNQGTPAVEATFINCTIIDNTWWPPGSAVAGLYVDDGHHAVVRNSIIWGNQPALSGSCEGHCGGQSPSCWCDEDCCMHGDCCADKFRICGGCDPAASEHYQIVGSADVSHSIVQGLLPNSQYAGPGVIGDDPLFADEDGRLSKDSPAIDAGLNELLPDDIDTDLDGKPRIVDGTGDGDKIVDMGAYEFQSPAPGIPGDLNGDGVVDMQDLIILLLAWGPCAGDSAAMGVPPAEPGAQGSCPADLNGDGVVDVLDLLILLDNWG